MNQKKFTSLNSLKYFLKYNDISYPNGRITLNCNVDYTDGNNRELNTSGKVFFDFVHTDFTHDISLHIDLDSSYFSQFSYNYQTYKFNKEDNTLIIEGEDTKTGTWYRVAIIILTPNLSQ